MSKHMLLPAASLALSLSLWLALPACSDGETLVPDAGTDSLGADGLAADGTGTADSGSLGATIKAPVAYSVAKGTVTVQLETTGPVTKVELLVDGKAAASATSAPFSLSWDSTKAADGLATLSVKATSAQSSATSAEVTVVVLNQGQEVQFTDGSSGTVTVPSTGYVDQHLKYHWTMPDGIKQVLGLLFWDQTGFKLELTLGVGECPDNGTVAAKQESATSPAQVLYPTTVAGTLGQGQWFAHVQLMNGSEVLGKNTPFSVKAYLLK